jgi:hypothetical protein
MKRVFWLLVSAIAVFGAWEALAANSGTQVLTRDAAVGSTRSCDVGVARTCMFAFNTVDANSVVFIVPTAGAIACLDADVTQAHNIANPARVDFWRVVYDGDKTGGFVPTASTAASLTEADNNCFTLPTGLWWIEVVAVQSSYSGTNAFSLVSLTGQE